jgi:hypothetical protein
MDAKRLARIGGALYLIIIIIGFYNEAIVRDRLVVSGDAMATAANIRAHESLWRFHIGAELFLLICAITLLAILYVLFRPVSKDLMLLAVLFNAISIGLEAAITMYLLVALFPLTSTTTAFSPEQLAVMSSLSLRSHANGFGVSLLFFGCFCVVIGYVIFKSGLIPKAVGVLMQIAGACYLINSFALIVSPPVANRLFPAILLPALIGELSLSLWLLIKGVRVGSPLQ